MPGLVVGNFTMEKSQPEAQSIAPSKDLFESEKVSKLQSKRAIDIPGDVLAT